ncbi:unnamed protein product [Pelagomonas calceolata]|uniref:Uncharacterized protein n=3 Tax=Pelagomonas calceolata TaxID=35677 RepID=A0A8J2SDT2_9STRA|nr:unnamed protein product [Pelagomonas calceolata]
MMEPGPFQQSFYPDGEHQYLLPDDDGALPAYATTRRTWIMFCVTFGVLHGCAVTSMVYASSLQGKDLSSASLGAFFAAYTTAALFVATDVVRRVGVLYALLTGFCGYVLLAASYLSYEILGGGAVADAVVICVEIKIYGAFVLNHRVVLHAIDATPARRRGGVNSSPLDRARTAASSPRNDLVKNCRVYPTHWLITTQVVLLASVGAGVGGATLWVGQTQHYAQASAAHADVQQIPAKEASADFATLFAVIYVAMEACVKVATAVALGLGATLEGATAGLVGVGACATAFFVHDPLELGLARGARGKPSSDVGKSLRAVALAHVADPRLWLLAPLPLGFGFSSALFTDWVDGLVDEKRGAAAVAVCSTVTTVTAGLAAIVLAGAARKGGPRAPVAVAFSSYAVLGVCLCAHSTSDLMAWRQLVLLFALQGVNRAVFENSTKHIYVEFFRGTPCAAAALASIYVHSGFASTITYFTLFAENKGLGGATLIAFAALIAFGFAAAETRPRPPKSLDDPYS